MGTNLRQVVLPFMISFACLLVAAIRFWDAIGHGHSQDIWDAVAVSVASVAIASGVASHILAHATSPPPPPAPPPSPPPAHADESPQLPPPESQISHLRTSPSNSDPSLSLERIDDEAEGGHIGLPLAPPAAAMNEEYDVDQKAQAFIAQFRQRLALQKSPG